MDLENNTTKRNTTGEVEGQNQSTSISHSCACPLCHLVSRNDSASGE